MAANRDPLEYYAILGVDPSAPLDRIKRAFKSRAQELHPDKNPSADTTPDFQRLNEAYQVLGDADSRSDYDAKAYILDEESEEGNRGTFGPIVCCVCGKISIQPRYVIYRQVVSMLFATYRTGCEGVFCAKCGATRAYKTSGLTWLLGWWGIPWGPIYSIHAIVRNMLGEQPAITNFRVLATQAAHFASENRMDIARVLADQALEFVPKIPAFASNQESAADHNLKALLAAIRDSEPSPSRPLKASWGIKSLAFRLQALAASAVGLVLVVILISSATHAGTAYRQVPPGDAFGQAASSAGSTEPQVSSADVDANAHKNQGPDEGLISNAQGGIQESVPFSEPPHLLPPTGRMHILRKRSREVTAPFKIATYSGSPNYYVKLVDLSKQVPVLFLFIRSGESLSTEMPLGRFELRLTNGGTWYGEGYLFGPKTSYSKADTDLTFERDGDNVAGYTLQLQKQVDGNLRETRIAASDF